MPHKSGEVHKNEMKIAHMNTLKSKKAFTLISRNHRSNVPVTFVIF